ncbi:MAG: branched-chain amino acid ABC transporter permease [Pseudomonadales bacterium]|jgi:branched-subunit amino acid ABC-type transport system permease component|nr:branched-chain amino acid ABC transporter permease [Rhodospirillaceae bacterium]MCH2345147.1 branched-chain amino acid ABC transporter permease [Pseudomonadales bacterium]|tara:strand:+ start:1660 stop:2538 length:879 start_codon:yes stop_codon:yes gene_type:complete
MDGWIQILVSGLTVGAMYAVSTVSLSLVWGALNVLNMGQGAMLAAGGYIAYTAVMSLGLPIPIAIVVAVIVGALIGGAMYFLIIRFMIGKEGFETNVIVATFGFALILENLVLRLYGAYPLRQPIGLEGGWYVGATHIPYQNMLLVVVSGVLLVAVAYLLKTTQLGRSIRATAQNREATELMGIRISRVFLLVLLIGGGLAAISGIMLSTLTTLAPTMGYDPMLKAFIICVIAGLGNIYGALISAFVLGLFEVSIQFIFGVRFGFPALLLLVILALVWRPYGVFGKRKTERL